MNDNHMYSFVIVLDGAQMADNGVLSFVASNELGTSKASMKLTVLGKRKPIIALADICLNDMLNARNVDKKC